MKKLKMFLDSGLLNSIMSVCGGIGLLLSYAENDEKGLILCSVIFVTSVIRENK